MYERENGTLTITWEPNDEQAAEQAMSEVVDRFDEWNGVRYKLEDDVARAVRERYAELTEGSK